MHVHMLRHPSHLCLVVMLRYGMSLRSITGPCVCGPCPHAATYPYTMLLPACAYAAPLIHVRPFGACIHARCDTSCSTCRVMDAFRKPAAAWGGRDGSRCHQRAQGNGCGAPLGLGGSFHPADRAVRHRHTAVHAPSHPTFPIVSLAVTMRNDAPLRIKTHAVNIRFRVPYAIRIPSSWPSSITP